MAHAKVLTIEPFETSLREHTPLTSIGDPKALVEYLDQLNLKGDMVLDELKRVSSERDKYEQKANEAEKSTKDAWDEVANLRKLKDLTGNGDENKREDGDTCSDDTRVQNRVDGDPPSMSNKSLPASIKSPTTSARGLSLFSPKSRPIDSANPRQGSENLFSFDDEIPRLEIELNDRQQTIEGLENEVGNLKSDLAVTRESTQSMVQTLEEMTRELTGLREDKDRSIHELKEQVLESNRVSDELRTELLAAESGLQEYQHVSSLEDLSRINELDAQLHAAREELKTIRINEKADVDEVTQGRELQNTIVRLQTEISGMQSSSEQTEKRIDTSNKIVATLRAQLKEADETNQELKVVVEKTSKASMLLQEKVDRLELGVGTGEPNHTQERGTSDDPQKMNSESQSVTANSAIPQTLPNSGKRKSKKKKKIHKPSVEHSQDPRSNPSLELDVQGSGEKDSPDTDISSRLHQELRHVRNLLDEKDATIERMHGNLKDQEGLHEEIDTLRDDLVNLGQEHVEAKDKIKNLVAEKIVLENKANFLEKELTELHDVHISSVAGSDQRQKELTTKFEDLKVKATVLQTDLSAAQNLASSRFKDLNELRNVLQKAQPEMNTLRKEVAEVKSVKEALRKKDIEFRDLDSRRNEMSLEIAGLKTFIRDRESEISSLSQRLGHESSSRNKADEASSKLVQEVQRLEAEKRWAMESSNRLTKELEKARVDLSTSKTRLRDIEQQLSMTKMDNESLKEEFDLKTAQYASAQNLMASMRDQTTEMAMQMKEARKRCESLEEEIADAHRLLSERSREAETMRRLLADVEGRAEARTREMKERMDTAFEERDQAEDEASTAGRRRARELEDLRNKHRDLERSLKRAEEDKEELQLAQRDWKRRREELEHQGRQSAREVSEIQRAMGELRDAFDESETQARELEKQKAELQRSVEEAQHRLEKAQKSNKVRRGDIHAENPCDGADVACLPRSRWPMKLASFKRLKANPSMLAHHLALPPIRHHG